MKVLVNATPLLSPLTGIGQYIRYLFTAMQQTGKAELRMYTGLRCVDRVTLPPEGMSAVRQRGYNWLQRVLPRPRSLRRMAEKLMFARHSRWQVETVLYHEPNYIALPYAGPLVLTVCDMSCFDHPETHPQERVRLMEKHLPESLHRADQIIVISKSSGDALQRWFNIEPARITTTYLAADARFRPRDAATLVPALAGLGLTPAQYILSVGTLEPRKNLGTLFAAYAGLPARLRERYPLVVAGMSGWLTGQLLKSAEDMVKRREIRLLGYVPDALIPPLFAGATVFCYPSRYEGFGLPALEAMASGIPVITSNATSLPEVVGDAGVMLDPDDVTGLTDRLQQLLEDRVVAATLGGRGLARAQTFSWARCAEETLAVYETVMAKRGARVG
jgi:alpha-1,3-rhamnosyl/mannosyltransferase